jgi:hypothetical protein
LLIKNSFEKNTLKKRPCSRGPIRLNVQVSGVFDL